MKDIRMKGFLELVGIEEALKRFFEHVRLDKPEVEDINIDDALGRVLAEDVRSEWDVPPFNRAAMDGYAVRSVDTVGASLTSPLVLNVVGVSEMAHHPTATVKRFEAVRTSTGASMPDGADSVVMVEYTRRLDEDRIEIYRPVTPYRNVSLRGEDVKRGERVLERGITLQPHDIGILAAVRMRSVKVFRKIRVAVLSTGNELVDLGEKVEPRKIVDVNRHTLIALVREVGCEPVDLGIARDRLEEISLKISEGVKLAEIVLVSGGISVGAKDLVSEAVNRLGKPGIIVHGISMRPGMPTALAALESRPVVLFPGSPVAALIAFNTFVRQIVAKMLGVSTGYVKGQIIRARITRKVASQTGLRTFLRVIVRRDDGEYIAEPVRTSGSGIISSIVKANGMVIVPEWKEGLEENEQVEVEVLRPLPR